MVASRTELPPDELPNDLAPLPQGWNYAPLVLLADERGISYGIVQPGTDDPNGVPIVRVNNLKDGRVVTDGSMRVSHEIEKKYARTRLRGGEVLLSLVGSLGECAVVSEQLVNWNVARAVAVISVKPEIGSRWVALCLRSHTLQHFIHTWATTTVQATLNLRDVAKLPIPIPPPAERDAISNLLWVLDDKIELNRRMNETLEGMVRAIFKSWFVDFDPVRAKVDGHQPPHMDAEFARAFPSRFTKSKHGPIPDGWRIVPLPEAIEVNPSRPLPSGENAPYLDMGNMPTRSARATAWISRTFSSGMRFANGDSLVARITPCLENGKTAFVDFLPDGKIGWGSTEYIVLRCKPPLPPEYSYFLARTDEFRSHTIANMTGTSGRQRVPSSCLDSFPVVVPSPTVAERFGRIASSIMSTMKQRDEESGTLSAIRDALLPKLLSGELRLKEATRIAEKTE